MRPIRISDEIKKSIPEIQPPNSIPFTYFPHEDISKINRYLSSKFKDLHVSKKYKRDIEKKNNSSLDHQLNLDLYINERVLEKMYSHCSKLARNHYEALGFLIGDVHIWDKKTYSMVHDVVTSDLESTPVSVRFHRDAFEKLFSQLDEINYDYIIIGWYHSHPGFSCFMSSIDIETQKKYFNKTFHAAIVIDPIHFELRTFRIQNKDCVEMPYAIFQNQKK